MSVCILDGFGQCASIIDRLKTFPVTLVLLRETRLTCGRAGRKMRERERKEKIEEYVLR